MKRYDMLSQDMLLYLAEIGTAWEMKCYRTFIHVNCWWRIR